MKRPDKIIFVLSGVQVAVEFIASLVWNAFTGKYIESAGCLGGLTAISTFAEGVIAVYLPSPPLPDINALEKVRSYTPSLLISTVKLL
jgi:hypothetical protein